MCKAACTWLWVGPRFHEGPAESQTLLADGGDDSDCGGVWPQYLQPLCPMRWRCPREHKVRVAPGKMVLQALAWRDVVGWAGSPSGTDGWCLTATEDSSQESP